MAAKDYATQDVALLKEIQSAAEQRLAAQLTAALAADQRALVFAGFVGAIDIALGGAAATVLTGTTVDHFLGWLALIAAAGMTLSMTFAVWSARPTAWFYPGGSPSSWISDVSNKVSEVDRLPALIDDYDDRIVANDAAMRSNGKKLWISNILAISSLAVGVVGLIYISHPLDLIRYYVCPVSTAPGQSGV